MKKILSIVVCIAMFLSVGGSFADTHGSDYSLKADLMNGRITEEEYHQEVSLKSNQKDSRVSTFSSEISSFEDVNLDDYYVYGSEVIEVDGVEFEEVYYKKKVSNNLFSKMLSVFRSSGPENGDFKIVISKEQLSGKDFFDTVEGYGSYLLNESTFELFKLGTYLDSSNIRAFLTNKFIEYIEGGMKGKGTSYSLDRNVYKWGQIYKNGSWVDYYYGKQYEVKWGFKFIVYNSSNDVVDDDEFKYYYESDDPIFIKAGRYFRDNNKVFEICNDLYKSNGYIYRDTTLSVTKKASDWERGIDPCYK